MPRPEKDYGLTLRQDIDKVTRNVDALQDKRKRLIGAYEAYTEKPFNPDESENRPTRRKRRRAGRASAAR